MKTLRIISRVIVGLVFMFSGAVKAIDPLGSAYKFNDYFLAFGLDFLRPLALVLAVILFTAEFISGFAVLSGFRIRTGIWGVSILMMIFTPLTLALALTNPVSDCGCFGDAIHLTNWQTFLKNVILLAFTFILYNGRRTFIPRTRPSGEWAIVGSIIVLFTGFALLNLRYLQLIDFLPYKTGVNIPEAMKIPEGMPADEYETTFIYEKDGLQKEFTLENYPADDTTWKFIDQKSVLVKKGYVPPIHDFSITGPDGTDIAEQVLATPGYTLIMISTKLEKALPSQLQEGFEMGRQCIEKGINFIVLTASASDGLTEHDNDFTFYLGDETTLKTIVRANPGYLLLNEGNIAGKWSHASLPPGEDFTADMTPGQILKMNKKSPVLTVYTIMVSVIILVLLISSNISKGRDGSEN